MEQFTSQELVYLAHCARKMARDDEARAAQTGGPMRDCAEFSSKTYYELAAKCERISKAVR